MFRTQPEDHGYIAGRNLLISIARFAAVILLIIAANPVHAINIARISSDQARYDVTDQVNFSVVLQGTVTGSQQLQITYRHLGDVVSTETVSVTSRGVDWSWQPPSIDYQGYTVELQLVDNGSVADTSSIAVDVSSDWAKFPRYGFLSSYPNLTAVGMNAVIDNLSRYHINGLQFYDWFDKHHDPLAGTSTSPDATWQDIANRTNYYAAVLGYINRAHDKNMMAMSYNLAYGSLDDAASDGVSSSWGLYTDYAATNQAAHDLPETWKSDIYLLDPSNTQWRQYIANKTAEAFTALPFDGWHIDQLGNLGTLYTSDHNSVNLENELGPFINAMSSSLNTRFVCNAVNQYGQAGIVAADVEFLYTEVWEPNNHYNDLANIILANNAYGNGQLNSVLAAYVNYNPDNLSRTFNTPSVLLADAVIFAFGGAHLELGEHMLSNEYFPADNQQMTQDLSERLVGYYDFLVGYQNLLRDGGEFAANPLTSSNTNLTMWPAQQGNVSVINKTVDDYEIFHLINFTDAAHMDWRDTDATQQAPSLITGLELTFTSNTEIGKLWAASPDDHGIPIELPFTQDASGLVTFTLPSLEYWTMIVAEPLAALQGDINNDGFVGLDDLDIILQNWNQSVPIGDKSQGDIAGIGDGYIGLEDLDVLLTNWNAGTPPTQSTTPIPEPTTLTTCLLLTLLTRRPRC